MFKSLRDDAERVAIELDGKAVRVAAGVSVAAALLELDCIPFRHSPVGAGPRAPFCMMGACYDCLVEIDGMPNQRACQRQVSAGMRVRRQLVEDAPA
jgi:predicted molibdopterin-dependent oxidoreductase YjgC